MNEASVAVLSIDLQDGFKDDTEAEALRTFIYCYVHELGHCFNLMHSWQKSYADPPQTDRPYALAWMNYPDRCDMLPGNSSGDFYGNFRFRFDDEELIHIRHGDRNDVIFGGKPFSEGAALSDIPDLEGDAPVELTVRSKGYFRFLEPVILEFKIKNISSIAMPMDTELSPESGSVMLFIERPDGRTMVYEPAMCKLQPPTITDLAPGGRHCQMVRVSFGRHGYYFDAPGMYRVKAVYQGAGSLLISSKIHAVRVGLPLTEEENRAAQDFCGFDTGLTLYLGGSDSRFRKAGMDTLRDMSERFSKSPVGAQISLVLAENLARPFRMIKKGKRVVTRKASPKDALKLINRAIEQHGRDDTTFANITYEQACWVKAGALAATGKKAEGKRLISGLVKYLGARGVKKDVLTRIEAGAKKL